MTPARLVLLLSLLGPLLGGGCATDDTRGRLVQLEVEVARLQRELSEGAAAAERLAALEASRALAGRPDEETSARLATLEAELLALRARLDALAAAPAEGAEAPLATPSDRPGGRRPPTLIEQPGGGGALPAEGEPVTVLTVGSGELLLIRTAAGLERVELVGLEAPRRAEAYGQVPAQRARHEQAFGRSLEGDTPWEASRSQLEELVRQGPVTLRYPSGDRRSLTGAIRAYLERPSPQGPRDLGATLIQAGYALAAEGDHERAVVYQRLQEEAHAAGEGLHREEQ